MNAQLMVDLVISTAHGNDGQLVGVPCFKEAYYGDLAQERWGLIPVAQLDHYKGRCSVIWMRLFAELLHDLLVKAHYPPPILA
jgi:hypothetical protein